MRSRSPQVADRLEDLDVGQVHEAFAAQDEVGAGEVVAHDVRVHEAPAPRAGADVAAAVRLDQVADDVDADVAPHGQIRRLHPVEVPAAGVEEHVDPEARQQVGERGAQPGGALEPGPRPGGRLVAAPRPPAVDLGEDRLAVVFRHRNEVLRPDYRGRR